MSRILKYFKPEFNIGHVLTILSMVGTILLMWRAVEMKAVQTELKVDALKREVKDDKQAMIDERKERQKRDSEISDSLAATSLRLQTIAENQFLMTGILQGKGLIDKK